MLQKIAKKEFYQSVGKRTIKAFIITPAIVECVSEVIPINHLNKTKTFKKRLKKAEFGYQFFF